MNLSVTRICLFVISVTVALSCVHARDATWYQKRVTWQYGEDSGVWETTVASPDKGKHKQYRFGLLPLWAVEGGVIAMEIMVANPDHSDENLLGVRDNSPHPFVIEVKELRHGVNRSRFGGTHKFNLGEMNVVVKIMGVRLGKGVGSGATYCKDCDNIQEFTADFSFESN